MKKRIGTLLLALLLLCALALPALGSSGNTAVYFLAVNDKFYDGYRPVAVDGVIYIPYTTFDRDATGVDLGVYYGIDQAQDIVLTLYSFSGLLTFRVKMGVCEDSQGNAMNFHALLRNGIPYVPASAVCRFFGLKYSFLPTSDRGTLIRITSNSNVMEDGFFLSSAAGAMSYRYNQVMQSLNPQPSSPAATPAPTSAPVPTPAPSSPPDGRENVRVYLALDASHAGSDVVDLIPSGTFVLFLFTPDSLPSQSALVRRAAAAGHSIGLRVQGRLEEVQAQLEEGNDLLAHIARVKTHIVSAPGELTAALESQGWTCWRSNVTGSTAAAILNGLETRQAVARVDLPASSNVVSRVFAQLRQDSYTLRQPLETEL